MPSHLLRRDVSLLPGLSLALSPLLAVAIVAALTLIGAL